MSPSRPFILRPVATSLMMLAILLSGILAYQFLPLSALPAVDGYTGKPVLPYAAWGIGISNNSEHKAEAWKLVSYLTSPEVNGKLVTIANAFPGNVNAKPDLSKADPLFVKAFQIFQSGKLANEFIGLPVAEQLQRDMDVELQKMLDGQQTPQQAAAATQKQWLAAFAKN